MKAEVKCGLCRRTHPAEEFLDDSLKAELFRWGRQCVEKAGRYSALLR